MNHAHIGPKPIIFAVLMALALAAALAPLFYSAYAQESSAPAKPTGLSATATHDSVTLTWPDPQDNSITGYRILRQEPAEDDPGQFAVLTEDTGSPEPGHTDTDVTPERTFVYQVQARSPQGVSESSPVIQVSTPPTPQTLEATVSEPRNGDFSPPGRSPGAISPSASPPPGRSGRRETGTRSGWSWRAGSPIRSM